MADLFRKRQIADDKFEIGLTDDAFDLFGQIWSIIPTNERKRNFTKDEPIIAIEGSESLGAVTIPFNVKRISFNGTALDRPDELTNNTALFYAEAA